MNKLFQNIQACLGPVGKSPIFVAVSGGVDSMVLLHATKILNYNPIALHVNYQLRGKESDDDDAFVREQCSRLNIEFHVKKVHLNKILKEEGGNLQNRARTLRYAWFKETAKHFNNDSIVLLGQHKDDQIETFLLQLFRGAGMRGLSAMPSKRDIFIRPLLKIDRSEILQFAKNNDIEWREDNTNSSLKYSRNKLRNEFIPFMEQRVPSVEKDILFLVNLFQVHYRSLQMKAQQKVSKIFEGDSVSFEELKTWDDTLLIEVLRQLKIAPQIIREIKKLMRSENNKYIDIEHKYFERILSINGTLKFIRKSNFPLVSLLIEHIQELPHTFDKDCIYLDEKKLSGPLRLRRWKKGDKIASLGVKGSQLVSKILHNAKVPAMERENYYVLSDDLQIHWCPRFKIGRNALATEESNQIIKCSITYKECAE